MTEPSLDVLIHEVALGLADDADAARLRDMAARDPDVALRLAQARARFAPLDDTADEVDLPAGFWDRIDAALDTPAEETAPEDAAPAPAHVAEVTDLSAVRRTLTRWRSTAVGGLAATILLALTLGWTLMTPADPAVIAVLLNDRGEAIALVEGRPDNTTLVTLLERAEVSSERVMQVWTKPEDDGPPVSLGLLPTGRSSTLTVEGLPPPHAQQLYEITVEPAGGSPTNLPTGPILGKGLAKEPVV